jgi:hypothetical protein
MKYEDLLKKLEQIEQEMSDLKFGQDPEFHQFDNDIKQLTDRYNELQQQKQAALKECLEQNPSDAAYRECVRQVEEKFEKLLKANLDEARPLSRARDELHVKKANKLTQQKKEIQQQMEALRQEEYQRAMAIEMENQRKMLLAQAENLRSLPIEQLSSYIQNFHSLPPEIQEVIRERMQEEGIEVPKSSPSGQSSSSHPISQEQLDQINSLPIETLRQISGSLESFPPEVQEAIRKRLEESDLRTSSDPSVRPEDEDPKQQAALEPSEIPDPQPAADPTSGGDGSSSDPGGTAAQYDPDDYHSPFPLLDLDIKKEIREMDPHTAEITTKALSGLLTLVAGQNPSKLVEQTGKVKQAIDTFVSIVTDKNYDSDAAATATKKLAVVVGEMAAGQTFGRAKTMGDLLALVLRETTRVTLGEEIAKTLPTDLYDAAKKALDMLPPATGIHQPGPAWKYWSGRLIDPRY